MTKYRFLRYSNKDFDAWNSFLSSAKNATFLFHRDFMDYHSHRFTDASFMVYNDKSLIALFPANLKNNYLYSHQGLSYGGLIFDKKIKFRVVTELFKQFLTHLTELGVSKLKVITLPHIYSDFANDEINYLLYKLNARLSNKRALSVLNLKSDYIISKNRLEGYKRGSKNNLILKYDDDLKKFWSQILKPNLKTKYNTAPLHSLEEIEKLKSSFPKNIIQVNIYDNEEIVAGATLFISEKVVKVQYISGNQNSNQSGSLDFLFYHLITNFFKEKIYFDFGSSEAEEIGTLNSGLQYWKEGFGARMLVQDSYEIDINNYDGLNGILV